MEHFDSVGKAIEDIKSNLHHLTEQHEQNVWMQLGKEKLSELLRGDKTTGQFSEEFFKFCFEFLNIQVGTFYQSTEGEKLNLIGSFGNKNEAVAEISREDPFYKHIVSQKQAHVIEGLKPDFFSVSTTLGTFQTASVLVLPLFFNGGLSGIVELGKLNQISPSELNFWRDNSESIAIYLNTISKKELLEKLIADLDSKEQQLQNQIHAINKAALVIEFDTEGNILDANTLFCESMGYAKEELLGKHHRIFVDPEVNYEETYRDFWFRLNHAELISGEFCRFSKSGKPVWLQASYNPVTDKNGKVYKVLKIGYNVTLVKEQQQELESITLKMNQQVEALNKAAIVSETDADGNIIFVNDFFCQISEFSREELIGNNHRILKSGKQPDGLFKGMWKAISSGLLWQGEILNKSKTGKYYWVETTIMPFKNSEGKIEKYVAIRFDITKQKESEALKRQTETLMATQRDLESANTELEAQTQKLQASEEELRVQQEELLQSNQELEEKTKLLGERNQAYNEKNNLLIAASADLKKKAEQLELSSKYKSEFLANMSHELRTPLNSILLLSKLMSDNLDGNLNSDQIEFASVINKAGSSLLELINDILDLSKIESGKMDVNPEIFALKDFEKEIFDLFHPISNDKSISFQIHIDKKCPETIFTDKLRIGQVIKNLLSNAFKFTPNGKVDLNMVLNKEKQMISFSVIDNGIGIPKDKQALVFEAFQQADGSTKRKYGGTGLGLSISREIAHLLGGEISLESEPGKGSNFTITVPIHYSELANQTVKAKNEKTLEVTLRPEKVKKASVKENKIEDDRSILVEGDKIILIVEDDIYFLKILQNSAKENGYKVLAADNGEDAVNLAKEYLPSGIILDLNLPLKNGWEVMKELKAFESTKHIPVHIVTSQDLDSKSVKEIGASDFSAKPLMESDLKKLFQNLSQFLMKDHGKVALFADREEHRQSIHGFLSERHLDISIYSADSEENYPDDFSIFDSIIIDVDHRKSGIPNLLEKIKNRISVPTMPVVILSNTYLSSLDTKRIFKYQDAFILKIAKSYNGIIDEISNFLSFVSRESSIKKLRPAIVSSKVLEGKNILVVDDDSENRFSIGKLLELQNVNVSYASNGKEAVENFKQNALGIHAILMDIMMPEMDGYEAMQEIRKIKEGKKTPIIALTAKTQSDERENCLKNGASDYLPKPVDAELLVSLLKVWINQSEKK